MRDEVEAQFKNILNPFLRDQRKRVIEAYRLGLELDWTEEEQELFFTLLPLAHAAVWDSLKRPENRIEDIDRAVAWARQAAREAAAQITRTTRASVLAAMRDVALFASGAGVVMEEILALLGSLLLAVFSEARAEMISATEVTRADTAATRLRLDELQAAGFNVYLVWQTERDYAVCPVCGPLDDKPEGDGWIGGPPAHVNCRCSVIIRFRNG